MTMRPQTRLKWLLGFNFGLSAITGLTATFAAAKVTAFTGLGPAWVILGVGLGLLIFATAIAWTVLRLRVGQSLLISILDLLWVVGTLPLTLIPGLLTQGGTLLVIALAAIVGLFAVFQLLAIRGILSHGAEPGSYRHCIRVNSAADPDRLWSVIRNLGAMERYSAGLSASRLEGGSEPGTGTVRVCTNHKGQSWTEEVQHLDDAARLVLLRFQSEAEDFPFPLAELSGGWSVAKNGNDGSTVEIWWIVKPNQRQFGWLIVALMTMALDRDVPRIVTAMEADAMGKAVPRSAFNATLAYC